MCLNIVYKPKFTLIAEYRKIEYLQAINTKITQKIRASQNHQSKLLEMKIKTKQ